MKAQHPFPTCTSNNDPINEKPEIITLAPNKVQKVQTGIYSTFSYRNMADILEHQIPSLVEISLSPAKYSIFQILGFKFFEMINHVGASSFHLSLRSGAIVGALGGTILSLLYFVLLFRGRHLPYEESNITPFSSYVQVLCKEAAYSGLAGVIGALAVGQSSAHDLYYFAVAGIIGPILFLTLMFSVVALVIGVIWGVTKFKHRWHTMVYF